MKQPWDTAIALTVIEEKCQLLKKELADGTFLAGHTAKKLEDINMTAVLSLATELDNAVDRFQTLVCE